MIDIRSLLETAKGQLLCKPYPPEKKLICNLSLLKTWSLRLSEKYKIGCSKSLLKTWNLSLLYMVVEVALLVYCPFYELWLKN